MSEDGCLSSGTSIFNNSDGAQMLRRNETSSMYISKTSSRYASKWFKWLPCDTVNVTHSLLDLLNLRHFSVLFNKEESKLVVTTEVFYAKFQGHTIFSLFPYHIVIKHIFELIEKRLIREDGESYSPEET